MYSVGTVCTWEFEPGILVVYVCNIPAKCLSMNIASGTGSYLAQELAR